MYPKLQVCLCLVIALFCTPGLCGGREWNEITDYININGAPVFEDQLFTISVAGDSGGWWVRPDGEEGIIYGNVDGFEHNPALFYFHKVDDELFLCCNGMFVHTNVHSMGTPDDCRLKKEPPGSMAKVIVEMDKELPFLVRFKRSQDNAYLSMDWIKANFGAMSTVPKKAWATKFYLNTSGYIYGSNVHKAGKSIERVTKEDVTLVIDPRYLPTISGGDQDQGQDRQDQRDQYQEQSTSSDNQHQKNHRLRNPVVQQQQDSLSDSDRWSLSDLRDVLTNPFRYSPFEERLDDHLYRVWGRR